MAIAFQCSCGKSYKVKPELAGKRVKCAACSKIMEVPAVEPQLEDLTSLSADPFAALDPLGSGALAAGPALPSLPHSPLGGSAQVANSSATSPGVAPWIWIAAGGGGLAVLVVVGLIVAATMGSGNAKTRSNVAVNNSTAPNASLPAATTAGNAVAPRPAPASAAVPPSGKPPQGWYEGYSKSGQFRAWYPRTPEIKQRSSPSPNGSTNEELLVADMESAGAVVGGSTKLPTLVVSKLSIRKWSASLAEDLVKRTKVRIASQEDRTVGGHYARYYTLTGEKSGTPFVQHVLYVLTSDRGYQFYWIGPTNRVNRADAETFFSSIRLTDVNGAVLAGPRVVSGQPDWQTFRSQSGNYSVDFPADPVLRQDQQTTPNGTVTRHSASVESDDRGGFVVFHNDLPSHIKDPSQAVSLIAKNATSQVAKSLEGNILEELDFPVPKLASKLFVLEGTFQGQPTRQHILFVFSQKKMYQVMWIGQPDSIPTKDIERFMGSFVADP